MLSCFKPKLPTKQLSYMASFIALAAAIYSVSVADNTIVDYKVAFQLISLPKNVKTCPIKDLVFLSISPA